MARPGNLLLLAALSGALGLLIALFGAALPPVGVPMIDDVLAGLATDHRAAMLAGCSLALAVFTIAGYLLPAVFDSLALAGLLGRLHHLGLESAPEALIAAFRKGPLLAEGRQFAGALWQNRSRGSRDPAWRSALDPASLLRPASRLRRSADRLFEQLSLLLLGIAVALLVWAPSTGTAMPRVLTVAIALALALYAATVLIGHIRAQQVGSIGESLRTLFPTAATELLVDRVAAIVTDDGAARTVAIETAGAAVSDGLAKAIEDLKATLANHDRRIGASVAAAVQRVVQPITTSVQETLGRIDDENATRARQLVEDVLGRFAEAFQRSFRTQLDEVGEILTRTKALAEELREAYAAAESRLAKSGEEVGRTLADSVGNSTAAAVQRQTEAMQALVERLGAAIEQTGSSLDQLGSRSEAAMAQWADQTDRVAATVIARSTEEMKRTAQAFNQVHTILETLSLSVLPAVNRLVATQDRLHATIDANQSTAQAMATAARDLGEAAKIAQQMVERQIVLTRELMQLSQGRPPAISAPSPDTKDETELARAIVDLRAESDELKSLPSL